MQSTDYRKLSPCPYFTYKFCNQHFSNTWWIDAGGKLLKVIYNTNLNTTVCIFVTKALFLLQ